MSGRKRGTERKDCIFREIGHFYNMQEHALVQSAIIKHLLLSINYFQAIFLKRVPLYLNPKVSRLCQDMKSYL